MTVQFVCYKIKWIFLIIHDYYKGEKERLWEKYM